MLSVVVISVVVLSGVVVPAWVLYGVVVSVVVISGVVVPVVVFFCCCGLSCCAFWCGTCVVPAVVLSLLWSRLLCFLVLWYLRWCFLLFVVRLLCALVLWYCGGAFCCCGLGCELSGVVVPAVVLSVVVV